MTGLGIGQHISHLEVQSGAAALKVHLRLWDDAFAQVISAVLSPPGLAAVMIAVAAASAPRTEAWFWAAMTFTLSVLAPLGCLLWLFRRGMVSDLDVCRREERFRPLAFTLAATFVAVAVLWLASGPALLLAVATAQLAQMMLVLSITMRWKVSMHGVAVGAWVTFLLYNLGYRAFPVLVALPLVVWARVHLRRHTLAQAIVGIVLGGLVTWAMLRWVAGGVRV